MFKNTVIRCEFCNEELNYLNHANHLQVCKYIPVDCDYGCGLKFYRNKLVDHKANECIKRTIKCAPCSQNFPANTIQNHFNICPKILVPCPQKCGVNSMPREVLEDHLKKSCIVLNKPCAFAYAGCNVKGNANTIKKHVNEKSGHHITLLEAFVRKLQAQLKLKESKPEPVIQKTTVNNDTIQQLSQTVNKLTEAQKQFTAKEEKTTQSIVKLTQMLEKLSKAQAQYTTMEENSKKCINHVTKTMEGLMQTVEKLSQTQKQLIANTEGASSFQKEMTSLRTDLNQLKIGVRGTISWKIKNWMMKSTYARVGLHTELYSDPFYYCGHKLRICLYPNGTADGLGSHTSVHVQIIPGDFDDIISWPFVYTLTITLLVKANQDDLESVLQKTISPPVYDSECIQMPKVIVNKSWGLSKFISQAEIENNINIKREDFIVIKVQ